MPMNAFTSRPGTVSWRRVRDLSDGRGILLVLALGIALVVRVLTDDRSAPDSRNTGSLNLSGVIAVIFILTAAAMLLRHRRGVLPSLLAAAWLCTWTAIAVGTHGASTETLREGVREASVAALAVIVYNARGAISVSAATRVVQLAGLVPAVIALYQLASHTGLDIASELRANGTFAHPNSAAMFFAIAGAASLWRYLDSGRSRLDALMTLLFLAAVIATYSIDGVITVIVMLIALGILRRGSFRANLGPYVVAVAVALAFFVTPLGAQRIAKESATNVATAEHEEANSSLAWRLNKWKTLIPEWESAPVLGHGIGTTTTGTRVPGNQFIGVLPHNEYIRYLVETGVAGVLVLLFALAMLTRALLRRRREQLPDRCVSDAAILAIVVVLGCLVNSLADNALLDSTTGYATALIVIAAISIPAARSPRPSAPATG